MDLKATDDIKYETHMEEDINNEPQSKLGDHHLKNVQNVSPPENYWLVTNSHRRNSTPLYMLPRSPSGVRPHVISTSAFLPHSYARMRMDMTVGPFKTVWHQGLTDCSVRIFDDGGAGNAAFSIRVSQRYDRNKSLGDLFPLHRVSVFATLERARLMREVEPFAVHRQPLGSLIASVVAWVCSAAQW